ncbi:hypothetical protein Vretimale_16617 [Volvox reticuliferus]|uniref:SGNH hydrolase-type esterase domain-containing protein n=1 Tax=Volvox reticuliferus TaxID=1737510 RepID=A0A8J4FWN2_9CHLO|nr:hypothetical protein Vretifemale_17497 [Volvox reticuliferus]GIM13520.1 hypothetical protein Vretimale_16617 [Volvox reticuliferus]
MARASTVLVLLLICNYGTSEVFHFVLNKPPKGQHCCPIDNSKLWRKTIRGIKEDSSAVIERFFNYEFYLPKAQLKAGLEYYGAARRLRKFVRTLLLGDNMPLKIGVIGGSISSGVGTTSYETRWFSIVSKWMRSVSGANITSRNGCIPATPSAYMLMCMEMSVDEDVDLVFVEYSVNDGVENVLVGNRIVKTMEQLVRRIMGLPRRPAVVLVQLPHLFGDIFEPFFHTSDDLEGALSGYYDIPSISLRNALYPLAALYPTDGFLWNQTYGDTHPGDSGHKIIADLAVHLIQETARDLQLDPIDPEEEQELMRPLPESMYFGNIPPPETECIASTRFKGLVKKAVGWGWVNEAKDGNNRGKWGYVSTKPGSKLIFQVDTRRPGVAPSDQIPLLLHYLKSYRGMGIARAECRSGCACEPLDIDAGLKAYHSQTIMIAIRVTQHEKCEMQLTLLNSTTNNGYKFKVSGVTIVGSSDYPADFFTMEFWNQP